MGEHRSDPAIASVIVGLSRSLHIESFRVSLLMLTHAGDNDDRDHARFF